MKDINLLPEDIRNPVGDMPVAGPERSGGLSAGTVVIMVVIAIFAVGILFAPHLYLKVLEAKKDSIDRAINSSTYTEVKKINGQLTSVDSILTKKQNVINNIESNALPAGKIINSIKQAAPSGVILSSIVLKDNKLDIEGYSADNLRIAEFMSNMNRLDSAGISYNGDTLKYDETNSSGKFKITYNIARKDDK